MDQQLPGRGATHLALAIINAAGVAETRWKFPTMLPRLQQHQVTRTA